MSTTASSGRERCDLAVVGAGAIGTMIAWRAQVENPRWSVLLVDQARPGAGATGLAGGLMLPLAATPRHAGLVTEGEPLWRELAHRLPGVQSPLRLLVVVSQENRPALDRMTVGRSLASASASEHRLLKAHYPDLTLGRDDVVLSADSRATAVDGQQLTRSLARELRRSNAVWSGAEVVAMEQYAGRVQVYFRSGRMIEASRVVEATGPWLTSKAFLPATTDDLRLKQVSALHLDTNVSRDCPAVLFHDDDLYVLPATEGRPALVSFYRDRWLDRQEPWNRVAEVEDFEEGRRALSARSSFLAGRVVGARTFADAYAPERLPVVRSADWPGTVIAGAGSGSGIRLAPGVARRALELLAPTHQDRNPANAIVGV